MALLKLTEILNVDRTIEAPRKLQTAVFLAQRSTGCDLYQFRVSGGKVISDALDQDLAELEAGGWVSASCSVKGRGPEFVIHPRSSTGERLSDAELRFKERLNGLLGESTDVLEAAATMSYAAEKSRTGALGTLRWLRNIEEEKLQYATMLYQSVTNGQTTT